MRLFIVLLSYFILVSSVSANEQLTPLTFEDYAKLPSKSMVTISPSGNRLSYRAVIKGRDLLVIIDLATSSIIRTLTIGEINPDDSYFIDENRLILVASDNRRIHGFKGRHDISVAFSYDIKDNKVIQLLVAGKGIYEGQSQLGEVVGVSPDGKYAYMPAWKSKSQYSLLKVNLSKKFKPRVYVKGTSDTSDFFLSSQGEPLARERFNNKKNRHLLEARHDGKWVEIYRNEAEIRTVNFSGVTPDGKSLVMKKHNNTTGRWAYHTISLKDGTISKAIFSKEGSDVESVLTDINRVVYGVRYSGFKPSYEFFDEKLNARMRGVAQSLPNNVMFITSYTPSWDNIIFHVSGNDISGGYLRYKSSQLDLVAHERNIPPQQVNPVEVSEYKARDGLTIPTLITTPIGREKPKNLPAIMLPHGGPESYDTLAYDWLAQYFSSQGYVVIQPQFRGSDGFGSAHKYAGRGEWGRKMQDDLTDAVNFYAKEGFIDANKVCIVGWSYGGYAALAGAAFTPDVYQCAVSINGVADVERMVRQERKDYGKNHWVVAYWNRVIKGGNLAEDHLEKISPINALDSIKIPVLLIHGEHDLIVPVKQSREMFDEMKDAKKRVSYVELENDNHHLEKPKSRLKALQAIDKFVKQHI